MKNTFNIIIEEGENGYLISDVVELPGCREKLCFSCTAEHMFCLCHTQAKNLDDLMKRTKEAISLYNS
ncbi:MAG: type II toxin-antitoxin system HicB family antitoxin [Candidatus Aenigmatarchaeota archaeon]